MSLNAIFDPMVRSYFDDGDSGGGLTVIELETVLVEGDNQLSETEVAVLSAAIGAKQPVVIRLTAFDDMQYSAVFGYVASSGIEGFFCQLQSWEIVFMCVAGQWRAVVQSAE